MCRSGDKCANIRADTLESYYSCSCPEGHLCVFKGSPHTHIIKELHFHGHAYTATCMPNWQLHQSWCNKWQVISTVPTAPLDELKTTVTQPPDFLNHSCILFGEKPVPSKCTIVRKNYAQLKKKKNPLICWIPLYKYVPNQNAQNYCIKIFAESGRKCLHQEQNTHYILYWNRLFVIVTTDHSKTNVM